LKKHCFFFCTCCNVIIFPAVHRTTAEVEARVDIDRSRRTPPTYYATRRCLVRFIKHEALEVVSKEPCISSIDSAHVLVHKSPMIAITTFVNDDFKIFPKKIFRFDMDIEKRTLKLRRFQND